MFQIRVQGAYWEWCLSFQRFLFKGDLRLYEGCLAAFTKYKNRLCADWHGTCTTVWVFYTDLCLIEGFNAETKGLPAIT